MRWSFFGKVTGVGLRPKHFRKAFQIKHPDGYHKSNNELLFHKGAINSPISQKH